MTIDVIALTQEMVRTPSLSGDEGSMAALVEQRMRDLGFDEIHRDENGSVLGLIGPADTDVAVLLVWAPGAFAPTVRNRRDAAGFRP